jgi:hypothetical protein
MSDRIWTRIAAAGGIVVIGKGASPPEEGEGAAHDRRRRYTLVSFPLTMGAFRRAGGSWNPASLYRLVCSGAPGQSPALGVR